MAQYSPSKLQSVIEGQGRRVYWIAEQADMHPTTIYRFLRGERAISDDAACRIAQILNVSPDTFRTEEKAEVA